MIALVQLGDYFGTLVFAITGGLAAAEKRLDLGGFILLAFVTGVGGGTMRDLILQREGVFWLDEPMYITLCVVGAILTFVFGAKVGRLNRRGHPGSRRAGVPMSRLVRERIPREGGVLPHTPFCPIRTRRRISHER